MSEGTQARITRTLIVLGVLVIVWRILAGAGGLGLGAPGGRSVASIALNTALGLMGLLFIGCGLAAWFRARTEAAASFALYGLCYGMHWGGVIPAYTQWLGNTFTLLHLVLSGVLSQAFLLTFALVYPRKTVVMEWRFAPYILFAPAFIAVVGMLVAILMQTDAAVLAELEGWLQLSETVLTNGYFLLAALVIWWRWWRMDKAVRRQTGAALMGAGLLLAVAPYVASVIVNSIAPAPWIYRFGAAPYTLFFSLIPATFLASILRQHRNAAHDNRPFV